MSGLICGSDGYRVHEAPDVTRILLKASLATKCFPLIIARACTCPASHQSVIRLPDDGTYRWVRIVRGSVGQPSHNLVKGVIRLAITIQGPSMAVFSILEVHDYTDSRPMSAIHAAAVKGVTMMERNLPFAQLHCHWLERSARVLARRTPLQGVDVIADESSATPEVLHFRRSGPPVTLVQVCHSPHCSSTSCNGIHAVSMQIDVHDCQ